MGNTKPINRKHPYRNGPRSHPKIPSKKMDAAFTVVGYLTKKVAESTGGSHTCPLPTPGALEWVLGKRQAMRPEVSQCLETGSFSDSLAGFASVFLGKGSIHLLISKCIVNVIVGWATRTWHTCFKADLRDRTYSGSGQKTLHRNGPRSHPGSPSENGRNF